MTRTVASSKVRRMMRDARGRHYTQIRVPVPGTRRTEWGPGGPLAVIRTHDITSPIATRALAWVREGQ